MRMTTSKPSVSSNWPALPEGAFAFASFSDLHWGHRRNDTERMIQAFDKSVYGNGLLSYIKLLVLAGDVFDRLLNLNDESIFAIDRWIARLLKRCAEAGVVLRVLEGTKSHDRAQSQRFEMLYEFLELKSDFRYVKDVEVEYIASLGCQVLFIPDEAHTSTVETKEVVQAMLQAKGLQQVDLAVMHGYFQHQLPYDTKEGSYHDLAYYESIVKHWITIGHVHTRSRVGKALAQGSHDRLSHGEEEAKGFVVATCRHPGKDDAWFIDNHHAHVYRTVTCYDMTAEHALAAIDAACEGIPTGSRVRIEAEPEHPVFESMLMLTNRWPLLHLTKHIKSKSEKTTVEKILEDVLSKWTPIRIDRESIGPLIEKRLLKREMDAEQRHRVLTHLQECV